jgi:hypothetical protein
MVAEEKAETENVDKKNSCHEVTPPSAKKTKKEKRHEERLEKIDQLLELKQEKLKLDKEKQELERAKLAAKERTNNLLERLVQNSERDKRDN